MITRSIVVVAALATVGGYAATPSIIAAVLERQFARAGFQEVQVVCGYPRRGAITLSVLQLTRQAGSWHYAFDAGDVTVRYDWRDLLARRLTAVHMAQLTIRRSAVLAKDRRAVPPPASLLDGHWLAALPVGEIAVHAASIDWRSTDDLTYRLRAALQVRHQQLMLQGSVGVAGRPASAMDFFLRADAGGATELRAYRPGTAVRPLLRVLNQATLGSDGKLAVAGLAHLDLAAGAALWQPAANAEAVQGALTSQWTGSLPTSGPAPMGFTGVALDSEHEVVLRAARWGTRIRQAELRSGLTARLRQGIWTWHAAARSYASARIDLGGDRARQPGGQLPVLIYRGAVSGRIDTSPSLIEVQLATGARIQLSPLSWGTARLPAATLELIDTADLSVYPVSGQWRVAPLSAVLHAFPLQVRQLTLGADRATLRLARCSGAGRTWEAAGTVALRHGAPVWERAKLPAGDVAVDFTISPRQFSARAAYTGGGTGLIGHAQVTHGLASGAGALQYRFEPLQFSLARPASQLLQPWPNAWQLNHGTLSVAGALRWRLPRGAVAGGTIHVDNDLDLRLDDLAGDYQTYQFSGLSGAVALHHDGAWHTRSPVRLRMRRLGLGVALTNLKAQFELVTKSAAAEPVLRVREVSADLLGGKLRSTAFEWDRSAAVTRLHLYLERLALHRLLALEGREDLDGSGAVSGRLPIEYAHGRVALHSGQLHAEPPGGWIRYQPRGGSGQALAGSHRGAAEALKALNNFQYDALTAHADATPNGDLELRVALQGRNPDWQGGRPVYLNVNLQENIPMLLRSLRFAETLGEQVGKRTQQNLRKRK